MGEPVDSHWLDGWLRKAAIRQNQLAKESGVAVQTICDVRHGRRRSFSDKAAKRIARVFTKRLGEKATRGLKDLLCASTEANNG